MTTLKINTQYQTYTYDVWGNELDGYQVNNVYKSDTVDLTIKLTLHNEGSHNAFYSGSPTDKQIRESLGIKPRVQIEDNIMAENVIYPEHCSTGYPLGEMRLISHNSLTFKPNEIITGHTWQKRSNHEYGLYFDLANGGSLYAGYITKSNNLWCCYPVDSDPEFTQNNTVKTAKFDMLNKAIAVLQDSYQFVSKYNCESWFN